MHQTFYIDIDEEITSVVDRLRRAKVAEVVIVVPKRALLIQSIVNLKLLKKEADRMGLQLILVTQDKLGKLLVEKAGISVEQKLENIADGEVDVFEPEPEVTILDEQNEEEGLRSEELDEKIRRIENLGSKDYYAEGKEGKAGQPKTKRKRDALKAGAEEERVIEEVEEELILAEIGAIEALESREMDNDSDSFVISEISRKEKRSAVPMDMVRGGRKSPTGAKKAQIKAAKKGPLKSEKAEKDPRPIKKKIAEKENTLQEEKISSFFIHEAPRKKAEPARKDVNLSKNFWRFFLIFLGVAALIVGLSLAYLFLPKASVIVHTTAKARSVDSEVKGDVNVMAIDFDKEAIPAKLVSVEDEVSKSFPASGEKGSAAQKAKGSLTIYNEFSNSPQPLVATTRFETADGKIFRLAKNVTIPGMTQVGGALQPGAIEAEVVADESGEEYNIGPADFTIPGFKSSGAEKYSKIYGKSSKAMAGGGNGKESIRTVSQGDVDNAKSKLANDIKASAIQKIRSMGGNGTIVLDDAIEVEDPTYTLSNSVGEVADSFTVTEKIHANALVFQEADLKSVVARMINRSGNGNSSIPIEAIDLEYGKADVDFKSGTMTIRAHGIGKMHPSLDVENIKRGILGKNEEEVGDYLKSFPDISDVQITYWPPFISGKIPLYGQRVEVLLDKN